MVTRADSALPWVAGAWLTGLWRVALVGGLTTGVVLVWALHDRGAAQVVPVADAEVSVVEVVTPVATVGSDSPAVPASDEAAPERETAPAAASERSAPADTVEPTARALPTQSGIIPGRPDPLAPLRPPAFERYVVQRGETLVLIGALRGVRLADLLLFNPGLGDGSVVPAGASIWIPIWEAGNDDAP